VKLGVCSSWAPGAPYAETFIGTFLRYWPCRAWIFYEGTRPRIHSASLCYLDLLRDVELRDFLAAAEKRAKRPTYRYDVAKFCRKVFALTHAIPTDLDWWVWLDGDVETIAPITDAWLAKVMPSDKAVSFLGRTQPHTETGWMAFNLCDAHARDMLFRMRETYTYQRVWDLPGWTDSDVFDHCLEAVPPALRLNLSTAKQGHVWPTSLLGEVMRHNKGESRKAERYGRVM
jgi:hypothetical protein